MKNLLSSETKKCLQLEKKLGQYTDILHKLDRDRLKSEVVNQKFASLDESELKEERLKLQLELENLRNSTSEQLKLDKEARDKENVQLLCQVEESEQREANLKQTIEVSHVES